MEHNVPLDYFISYTEADRQVAEWIAWQIEEMGHQVVLQDWDFKPGENFILKMQAAITIAKRMIAILSPEYLAANFTSAEWAAAFACDPEGKKKKLIPIKVKPLDGVNLGLFGPMVHIDVTGFSSKEEIKKHLFEKIKASEDGIRNKPDVEPSFPETLINVAETPHLRDQDHRTDKTVVPVPKTTETFEDRPEFRAGLVNKIEQAKHVFKCLDDKYFIDEQHAPSPLSFLLYGPATQWPEALGYKIYYQIKNAFISERPGYLKQPDPELVRLTERCFRNGIGPDQYLWELMSQRLNCEPTHEAVGNALGKEPVPRILFRTLLSDEYINPVLVGGMLEAWSKLKFNARCPRHILILFYGQTYEPKPIWQRWFNKTGQLIDQINKSLAKEQREKYLLPKMYSPKKKDINEWVDRHFEDWNAQNVKDFIDKEIRAEYWRRKNDRNESQDRLYRIRITANDYEIHHYDLKDILIEAQIKFGRSSTRRSF